MLDTLACDGENGALRRLHDCRIGNLIAADKRIAKLAGIDIAAMGQLQKNTLKNLRKDHAGIASGSQKHSIAELLQICAHLRPCLGIADTVFKRLAHIRAGIAVRNRKNIQRIDFFL